MTLKERLNSIGKRRRQRYLFMALGILALAPPVGFLAQAVGSSMLCGNLCPRMAIGPSFMRELFSRTWGVVLLFGWIGTTLFAGRWFCSHFCPAGALTEFARKLLPDRMKVDYSKHINTPLFRYGFFAAYLALPLVGMGSICCSFCNISVVPEAFWAIFVSDLRPMITSGSRLLPLAMFAGVLGVMARDGRGHCHLLCPIGALDSIVNRLGAALPFARRLRVDSNTCTGCSKCVKACPAWALSLGAEDRTPEISYSRCYQCRQCEDVCPQGSLGIRRKQ